MRGVYTSKSMAYNPPLKQHFLPSFSWLVPCFFFLIRFSACDVRPTREARKHTYSRLSLLYNLDDNKKQLVYRQYTQYLFDTLGPQPQLFISSRRECHKQVSVEVISHSIITFLLLVQSYIFKFFPMSHRTDWDLKMEEEGARYFNVGTIFLLSTTDIVEYLNHFTGGSSSSSFHSLTDCIYFDGCIWYVPFTCCEETFDRLKGDRRAKGHKPPITKEEEEDVDWCGPIKGPDFSTSPLLVKIKISFCFLRNPSRKTFNSINSVSPTKQFFYFKMRISIFRDVDGPSSRETLKFWGKKKKFVLIEFFVNRLETRAIHFFLLNRKFFCRNFSLVK